MRLVLDMGDNEKIDLSKKDKGKEHDDHWRPGIANAPQNASVDLVQAGKESEPTVRSDEKGAIINNVWICIENPSFIKLSVFRPLIAHYMEICCILSNIRASGSNPLHPARNRIPALLQEKHRFGLILAAVWGILIL